MAPGAAALARADRCLRGRKCASVGDTDMYDEHMEDDGDDGRNLGQRVSVKSRVRRYQRRQNGH